MYLRAETPIKFYQSRKTSAGAVSDALIGEV